MNRMAKEQAKVMFVVGHTITEIAQRFGQSPSTIAGLASRENWMILRQMHRRKLGLIPQEQNAKAS